jgi:uncharacterized membrane protein YhhN
VTGSIVTAVATVVLVWATRARHPLARVAKPVASAGFLLAAAQVANVPLDRRGWLVVAGLTLGAIGDLLLMGSSAGSFLAGLASFLVGHVAYAVAFWFDRSADWLAAGSGVAVLLAVTAGRWLRPHLEGHFRVAVPVYVVVISVMVAVAIGAATTRPSAAAGALLFAVSDVFVARQQFVSDSPFNPTIGLPLYYLAQLLIAFSL